MKVIAKCVVICLIVSSIFTNGTTFANVDEKSTEMPLQEDQVEVEPEISEPVEQPDATLSSESNEEEEAVTLPTEELPSSEELDQPQQDEQTGTKLDEVLVDKDSSEHLVSDNPVDESAITRMTRSVVEVDNETAFRAALRDKTVSVIHITGDFTIASGYVDYAAENRSLVINGNNHTIDFRGMTVLFYTNATNPLRIEIRDLNMLGRNYYGPVRMYGIRGTGSIVYHNITYTGAQMTASYEADIEISGHVEVHNALEYRGLTGETITTQASGQQNFEATNMRFLANSTYVGTTVNSGAFDLYSGGSVYVEAGARIDVSSSGIGGEAPSATIEAEGKFYVEEGASVNISTTADSNRGGIALGADGEIVIERGATLTVRLNGRLGYPGLSIGDRAKFIVRDQATFDMQAVNQGSSTIATVRTGTSSSFLIGDRAEFNVNSDGTGAKNLIYVGGSSTFQFANAKRVNLQLDNTNTSSRLLYMVSPSRWNVDVQSVRAWEANDWNGDTGESHLWNPMFNMVITYSGSNVTKAEGQSMDADTAARFQNEFRTQNFKRVLFEYIPDVSVDLDPLSNHSEQANSYMLTGIATPHAFIRFTGDAAIPDGTIVSPLPNESNYHVRADSLGKYLYSLPEGEYLTSGNSVTAFAFLNGKSNQDTELVSDKTAPNRPQLRELEDRSTHVSGTTEPKATVTIRLLDGQVIGVVEADEAGEFSYALLEAQRPLRPGEMFVAYATDVAGNQSEYSNEVIVADTTPPEAKATLQQVDIGYTLPENLGTLFQTLTDNAGDEHIVITRLTEPDFQQVGFVNVRFAIADASNNTTHIDIPFFVKDQSTIVTDEYAFRANRLVWSWRDVPSEDDILLQRLVDDGNVQVWDLTNGTNVTDALVLANKGGLTDVPGDYRVILALAASEFDLQVEVLDGALGIRPDSSLLEYGVQRLQAYTTYHEPINQPRLTIIDDRQTMSSWRLTARVLEEVRGESGFGIFNNRQFVPLTSTEEAVVHHQQYGQLETPIDLSLLKFKQDDGLNQLGVMENVIQWTLTDAP